MLKRAAILLFLSSTLFAAGPSDQVRLERIASWSGGYGPGGLSVLNQAFKALNESMYHLVGLEDLWTTALKEGRTLFPGKRLWRATSPSETGDMLGQTTIGPWQITVANAKEYGAAHGVSREWSDRKVIDVLESHPDLQARIAADFIEESYKAYGRRAPMAVQRYFWLDGFLQKKIGQGPWFANVLGKSAAAMKQTGFYAKQWLLGSRYNPEGLLYWLYRTGDEAAVRDVLQVWKEKGYPITMEDLNYCSCDPSFRAWLIPFLQ